MSGKDQNGQRKEKNKDALRRDFNQAMKENWLLALAMKTITSTRKECVNVGEPLSAVSPVWSTKSSPQVAPWPRLDQRDGRQVEQECKEIYSKVTQIKNFALLGKAIDKAHGNEKRVDQGMQAVQGVPSNAVHPTLQAFATKQMRAARHVAN